MTQIADLNDYFDKYGAVLGERASEKLDPLFRPDKDQVDDFSDLARQPFEPQAHIITAMNRTLDQVGSGFMIGEMGVGKTYCGMATVHKNAKGKPYRAIVLCPDHLISTWKQEIEETIPDAEIHTFDNWRGIVPLLDQGYMIDKGGRRSKRWPKPLVPEWYIIGRDQAKYKPDFIGVGENHVGFDKNMHADRCVRTRKTGYKEEYDEATQQLVRIPQYSSYLCCPKCGQFARNEKGMYIDPESVQKKQLKCNATWLRELADPDRKRCGLDRLPALPIDGKPGTIVERDGKNFEVVACGEPFWNYIAKPYRYPPALLFQKKLNQFCRYLVIDEVHEQKSDESAQSLAAGKLMASTRKVLALTGTLIGGYAHHLFPLLMRMSPSTVRNDPAAQFKWGELLNWSQVYGRVDKMIKTTQGDSGSSVGRRQSSMRKARTGRTEVSQAIRPGVMPTMYGRHMLGNSAFISLSELADELPNLDEFVAEGACDMDPDQADAYRFTEQKLVRANTELVAKGSIKLLSTMLWTTLDYPDRPFDWVGEHEGMPVVGYYDQPNDKSRDNFRGVVSPPNLDRDVIRPKERKLIDICLAEKGEGKQVWVYVQMTGKRNIQPRLKDLLTAQGLKVGILRAGDISPRERKAWIDKNAGKYDVIISNPRLVSTGLTLFDKGGDYNFPTLVFYQTGFNLFELRQASRRAWRIGQPHDCKVYYLYYRGTMQERAMNLMSRKMAAAASLDGKFSTEGLIGLADEDSAQIALARSINDKIGGNDMSRGWSKSKARPKAASNPHKLRLTTDEAEVHPGQWKPKPLTLADLDAMDTLTLDKQMVAQTHLETTEVQIGPDDQPEPVEIPKLSREQLAAMFASLEESGQEWEE